MEAKRQEDAGVAGGVNGLEALPEELLVYVLTFPSPPDLRALGQVSKSWRMRLQANDAVLWRPLALHLWTSTPNTASHSSLSSASPASSSSPEMEMERLKQAMDQEHGPSTASWCRFHRLLELMERNWAQLAFTPRHWYHNRADALTVRYTVEELVKWDETHDDENEEPEGWDKSSVNALAVDAGGRIVTGGDDGSVRVWDARGRYPRAPSVSLWLAPSRDLALIRHTTTRHTHWQPARLVH